MYDAVQTRHVLALMGFLGFVNVYALRVNLSVALVAMVNHTAILANSTPSSGEECKAEPANSTKEKLQDGTFIWNEYEQGIILGAFFYGYVVTQIPGGRLAERVGAKWLYGVGVLVTALLTLLTPVAASWSIYAFVTLRVMMGLGEGVTFPAMHAMIARWLPKDERSLLSTIIYSGGQIGTVVAMPVSGLLCDSTFLGGWPAAFYVFGLAGVVWFVFWALLAYNSPQEHPRISDEERIYIETNQGEEQTREQWGSAVRLCAMAGRKTKQISLSEKLIVIDAVDNGEKQTDSVRGMGLSKQTVNSVLKNKDIAEKRDSSEIQETRFRMRKATHPYVVSALLMWLRDACSCGIPVNGFLLESRTEQLAVTLGHDDITFSEGWLSHFKARHGVVFSAMCGERDSINESVLSDWQTNRLPALLAK
ncbi:hypothetical protein HPB50_025564 [Hyalomma asiaticum]|uniref:Uncharacterized protein n=1 Tax=Hyalomma asiaticum TaxID=266040 RepID=A0ACB7SQV6_HYAAI|nr:hypothetical protein HPB50_025564 [Hyalomma asiaticum]